MPTRTLSKRVLDPLGKSSPPEAIALNDFIIYSETVPNSGDLDVSYRDEQNILGCCAGLLCFLYATPPDKLSNSQPQGLDLSQCALAHSVRDVHSRILSIFQPELKRGPSFSAAACALPNRI